MAQNSPSYPPLYLVGLGPGSEQLLTFMAFTALKNSQCLCGYPLYLELLPKELVQGKIICKTPMRQEEERCRQAIASVLEGRSTSLVCSGDPGIYALAGLVYEILEQEGLLTKLCPTVVPGVPALAAAAALLGAPLGHDFACVSLSDLLTPLELIFQRLEAALKADFVLVLYNPKSQGRPHYLQKALDLAANFRQNDCPIGVVRNAFRAKQEVAIFPLREAYAYLSKVDMLSLVIIGNSTSRNLGQVFLTPRGYQLKISEQF